MSIESLAELLRFQSELAVDRAKRDIEQQKATAEAFTPTPAQAAYIPTIFAPGSGIADASGVFPEFPSADVPLSEYLSGEPMPSIAENIAAGGIDRYLIAPLQGLGVAGDALYAVPGVGPVLGATLGSGLKGIGALGIAARAVSKGAKTEKGITTLDETKNLIKADIDEYAKDEFGFVSPTLEALIREAPPNLKGPAISDWLAANTQKGVKPKELEVLGIDEFIEANPEATLSEVVAGVAPNKVQITKTVIYEGQQPPTIDFDVSLPEFDPLEPNTLNYQYRIDDINYALEKGDLEDIQYFADQYAAQRMTQDELASYGDEFTFEDVVTRTTKANESGASSETIDDVISELARDEYFSNPYELVEVTSVGETPAYIPDETFAFGNDEVGYQLFVGGERVTDPDNIAYSRAEAQIQLQNKLEEGGDPLRLADLSFDYDIATAEPGGARYKSYIDGTLPGGSNYREVVFRYENAPEPHNVTTHFDDDRALAHALIRDRKLDDGAETLHVDELQSDLHTEGSKSGYSTPEQDMDDTIKLGRMSSGISTEFTKLKNRILPKLENSGLNTDRLENIKIQITNAEELYAKSPQDRYSLIRMNDARRTMYEALNSYSEFEPGKIKVTLEDIAAFTPFDDAFRPAFEIATAKSNRVPNYPFKDDWYVMSLKQLIKDAIDEGKDAISVSTSAPIKARYTDQYSKFYESLYDQKIPSAMKKLANKYGGKFEKGARLDLDNTYTGREGKAFDEFLLERRNDRIDFDDPSGMKIVEEEFDSRLKANIIRITPEMRAKIAEEGLPSFAYGGSVNRQKTLTMPEDVNIFADAQFTQPETLSEKIVSGMTDLAFGRITKDDFFRDNVVRNVLTQLKVPSVIQNNLLRSEEAQNFALDTLQQAIGSPVDVTALGDDRFALDYSQRLGPGILSLASEFGKGEDTGRVSYDSKDFFIAPSTTARFAASLDKDRGKAFTTGVTYRPDPKTFVEGRAIFGEGRSPEYRIDFGRRF